MMMANVILEENESVLADVVANTLFDLVTQTIADRDICHMVFPGGVTPRLIFEKFKEKKLPWHKLHLYPSDERCVPKGSPDRNDLLIDELLIKPSVLPEENLHRIPAELGPIEGAKRFCSILSLVPTFDVALLGIGLDGHTASLFPGYHKDDLRDAIPIDNAPVPELKERVTISMKRLQLARERWVVLSGVRKRLIAKRIHHCESLPIVDVNPTCYFMDELAMGKREGVV
jgi:6-phosphogluconolactonase